MNKQSGNVLFLILIAVALFAALSYAVTKSTSGGGNANSETRQLAVSEALNYVTAIRTAAQRMKISGVANASLCFNTAAWGHTDYNHAACSSNENQIYHGEGGGVSWASAPKGLNAGGDWIFTAQNVARGAGSDSEADLVMILPDITEEACIAFEKTLGHTGAHLADGDGFASTKYIGNFTFGAVLESNSQYELCVQSGATIGAVTSGNYYFVAVIVAE